MTDTLVWWRPAESATGDPSYAAACLAEELRNLGMPADIHCGVGVALVSVWIDLVVWTNGVSYHWWSGNTSARGRRLYAYSPVSDPLTAARRVAVRYAELRGAHPSSKLVEEVQCVLPDDRRPVDLRGRHLAAPAQPG
ncbi:hypothetical protein Ppa06_25050 [Planomonospora parontospora subsp. parontospora]|uniref:Uncharacterized protein n=3 Tax=Planomonospora parontospora TaxID=58119 RepID=A0AA37F3T8_9ACTN|nr:hypothetical protein GCM10010126_20630 [Planomonospora parontospora]GII08707.1 hypothetical protein Ppa06_25050 [Planomonospora parontospora subsp. parontospora]